MVFVYLPEAFDTVNRLIPIKLHYFEIIDTNL